jgi:TonB-linked SusC/RagA family outer membrane protein
MTDRFRITLLLAALLPLPLMAQDVPAGRDLGPVVVAQSGPVSLLDRPARLAVRDVPLQDALSELQARSATPIVFSPTLLPGGTRVSCDCASGTVAQALNVLLAGLPLRYDVVGDYLVVERGTPARVDATPVLWASTAVDPPLTASVGAEDRPALRVVSGTIIDRLTGLAIRGASVELSPGGVRVETDADGRFHLLGRLAGAAELFVERPGYHAAAVPVDAAAEEHAIELRARVFAQQAGSIVGVVTDRTTGEPLGTVQISVEGTGFGTTSRADGRFAIVNVPRGTYTVTAQRIGYATGREENVRVASGATVQLEFALRTQALRLEEVVVTGVTDPTSGVKVPFSVGRLGAEDMPVPNMTSPIANLQGKIPGVHVSRETGQPGDEAFIQLRSPTSMIRSNQPMFVVDGVILGSTVGSSSIDIDALDIESMEVIKGAAAAALYGSRAAAGVISITTARGSDVAHNSTRVTARSETGWSDVPRDIPLATRHFYAVNQAGQFIDSEGIPTDDPNARVVNDERMMINDYPGPIYNNIRRFYRPGLFMSNSASLAQNTQATNFLISLNHYREKGTIVTNDGLERTSFRANIDHRLRDDLSLSTSVYHSRQHRDDISGGTVGEGSVFWNMMMFEPDIDLGLKDDDGNYVQQPHPQIFRENPLWRQTSRDNYHNRLRTLLSGQARFRPLSWLSLDGNVSYDRSDRTYTIYVPKGTPFVSSTDEDAASDGRLDKTEYFNDAINASAGINLLWNFGGLTTRSSGRAIMEREAYTRITADARDFWVEGVENLGVAQRMFTDGYAQDIRSNGFSWTLGLDYAGKYIGDVLLRRDGSSLFGPEARWANYYRVSAAYRMAQEDWWPFEAIGEFKMRFSQGTSGGRPSFSDRYETWSVSSSGTVSKSTLGNRFLKPEHTTEREFGLDMIFLDRYQLELTYATQETRDQIIQIPQPAVTGYSNQYQNSGTIWGETYEAALQAHLLSRGNLQWSSTLIADRMRSEFTEWNRVCYVPSVGYAFRCEGMNHTQFYGERFLSSMNDLPAWHAGSASQFAMNDDGYLVAVGDGSLSDPQWGEFVTIDGIDYRWGHPILERNEQGNLVQQVIGEGFPDFTLGWQNQLRWGNLSLFSHVHASIGGEVYNRTKQRLYQHFRHSDLDQSDKPGAERKPIDYYQTLYNANNISSHFVEPGGYLKLRELSLRYSMGPELLQTLRLDRVGTDRITLGLVGRNLFTLTEYSGFDPEVGTSNFIRADYFRWPNTRALTGLVEVTF